MIRNDLQHIQLDSQSQKEPALHEQEASTAAFFTAEGIELKPTYSEQDIENLDHLDFGAGFPYLRALYLCMCVALDHSSICWIFNSRSNAFLST
jgi:methylmalonyl-CoA mutase